MGGEQRTTLSATTHAAHQQLRRSCARAADVAQSTQAFSTTSLGWDRQLPYNNIALKEVQSVLWEHWDPLGLRELARWPTDEYDSYAPAILGLIRKGASVDQIAAHLAQIEHEYMAQEPSPFERRAAVAERARAAVARAPT